METESQGKCNSNGASGEYGCFQFMPQTWAGWSKKVFGYIASQTPINERYVALRKIQSHLDEGYNEEQVALIWNQGNASKCKAGTNSKGVAYDSCLYVKKVIGNLAMN